MEKIKKKEAEDSKRYGEEFIKAVRDGKAYFVFDGRRVNIFR